MDPSIDIDKRDHPMTTFDLEIWEMVIALAVAILLSTKWCAWVKVVCVAHRPVAIRYM